MPNLQNIYEYILNTYMICKHILLIAFINKPPVKFLQLFLSNSHYLTSGHSLRRGVLTLCRDVVGVFYSPSRMGYNTWYFPIFLSVAKWKRFQFAWQPVAKSPLRLLDGWDKKNEIKAWTKKKMTFSQMLVEQVKSTFNIAEFIGVFACIF